MPSIRMRLAKFIQDQVEQILADWELFARSLEPGKSMTKLALRNDAQSILLATARDMRMPQSDAQRSRKSKGQGGAGGDESDSLDDASVMHGVARVGSGFDITEVVSEYRALRASVLRLWRESLPDTDINDLDDVTRFHESIDQSLAKAVGSYTKRVEQSRKMFLAILSHDLRNPLTCIRMAAYVVKRKVDDREGVVALSQIETNAQVITRLIADLIDFASSGLGSAIPLTLGPVDLDALCRELIEGFRIANPQRELRFEPNGELKGTWDAGRLRQVISNLVGNALQHGAADRPITIAATTDEKSLRLSVHNGGEPIPPEHLPTIFDPLARYVSPDAKERHTAGSIGLGLYIVREIATAHGGTVEVRSTKDDGTIFTVRLPQHATT